MNERDLKCEEVLERLMEYLDRELDAQTASAMSRHLEDCRGCFGRAELELRLKQSLRATASEPATDRLRARIHDLIEKL